MAVVSLKEVKAGDVVATDLYANKVLILKAGTALTAENIRRLKKWGIEHIDILTAQDKTISRPAKAGIEKPLGIRRLFYESLYKVASEKRYGYALHNMEDFSYVESLFYKIMADEAIARLVKALKQWDEDSYLHSFDVFILGALLSKHLQMPDPLFFVTCCLLHDIGKLKVPIGILQKESELTDREKLLLKYQILNSDDVFRQLSGAEAIKGFTQAHHRRLDAGKLKNGEAGDWVTLDLLMIADVYSALTLDRPYREAYSSFQALEMLSKDDQKPLDRSFLIDFMEMLNIYPKNAIVRLSNGQTARVVQVTDQLPSMPRLKLFGSGKEIEIPPNLTTGIASFVQFGRLQKTMDVKSG